jgi:hypothetical protein
VAVRRLFGDRAFTATAVLTLALATGATTAVFTLVNAVLLRPWRTARPEQLVRIYDVQPDVARASVSVPDRTTGSRRTRSLSGLALSLAGPTRAHGGRASRSGSPRSGSERWERSGVLGLPPLLGREFIPRTRTDRFGGPAGGDARRDAYARKAVLPAGRTSWASTRAPRQDRRPRWLPGRRGPRAAPLVRRLGRPGSRLQNTTRPIPPPPPGGKMHFPWNAIGRLAPGVTGAGGGRRNLTSVGEGPSPWSYSDYLAPPHPGGALDGRAPGPGPGTLPGAPSVRWYALVYCSSPASNPGQYSFGPKGRAPLREGGGEDGPRGGFRWRVARGLAGRGGMCSRWWGPVSGCAGGMGQASSILPRGYVAPRFRAPAPGQRRSWLLDVTRGVLAFSVGRCVLTSVLFGVYMLLHSCSHGAIRSAVRGENAPLRRPPDAVGLQSPHWLVLPRSRSPWPRRLRARPW